MEFKITGLKCDNHLCDYRDDNITFDEYPSYIDASCPECGCVLLTQEEYDECLLMYKKFDKIKKAFNFFKWFNPFHYWRLVFGDKRNKYSIRQDF